MKFAFIHAEKASFPIAPKKDAPVKPGQGEEVDDAQADGECHPP